MNFPAILQEPLQTVRIKVYAKNKITILYYEMCKVYHSNFVKLLA